MKCFREQQDEVAERVSSGIEKNRKGSASIRVVDCDGNPLQNAKVKVVLKKHDFMHGANIFMSDEMETDEKNMLYREKFKAAFNLATIPIYWKDLEPEQGKPRFGKDSSKVYRRPAVDLCLEYCEDNNITPKTHCLNYFAHMPEWCTQEISETKVLIEKRFKELSERYGECISDWEVINETLGGYAAAFNHKMFYEPDVVEWSFELAKKYFPNHKLIINDDTPTTWGEVRYNRSAYYMQIERALQKNAAIDSIGMQYHLFHPKEDEERVLAQLGNPRNLYAVLNQYAKFELPIQITEITLPAYSWDKEDEEVQAELLRQLYSIWFSHEAVEAIIYWNLTDGYVANATPGDMTRGENVYHGGLLRFDMSEKPAYQVVKDLFHDEWHTEERFVTDMKGCGQFRGFYGTYNIEIEVDGQKHEQFIHFEKGNIAAIEIVI